MELIGVGLWKDKSLALGVSTHKYGRRGGNCGKVWVCWGRLARFPFSSSDIRSFLLCNVAKLLNHFRSSHNNDCICNHRTWNDLATHFYG